MVNKVFSGFTSGIEVVPSQFFEELVPDIESIAELKVTTFAFHLLNQFEGDKRFLLREWKQAAEEKVTPNCRAKCSACGARKYGGGVCFESTDPVF